MPPSATLRLVGPAGATCGPASICGPCGFVLPVLRIVQGVGPLAGREALDDAAKCNAAARRSCWCHLWPGFSVCGPCGLVLPVLL